MKNTSRIHRKINPQYQASQGKTATIHGQKPATVGHLKRGLTPGTILIGEQLGLSEKEIHAFALLSIFEEQFPAEYCKSALLHFMEIPFETVHAAAGGQFNEAARDKAAKLLPILSTLMDRPAWLKQPYPPQLKPKSPVPSHEDFDAVNKLYNAIRQTEALHEMLLNVLEGDNAGIFKGRSGHLAAGVQSIMDDTRQKLSAVYEALRTDNAGQN